MADFDYLVNHALKNVWCTPNQDMQSIVKPQRLTPYAGVLNFVTVLWRKHALPVSNAYFHIYQIGQIHPQLMGLLDISEQWKKISETCEEEALIVDIYTAKGVHLPRTKSWYMVTPDKNLILAIPIELSIPADLNNEAIFVRFYSNAYFNSVEADINDDFIRVRGGTMESTQDIQNLANAYNTAAALPNGHVTAYVNGFVVDAIDLINAAIGSIAEYVYDSSIYAVKSWLVADLPTFVSTLDTKHKYLLHYPEAGIRGINYQDDIDVFLVKPGVGNRFKGVSYNRNFTDSIRMVTHKDYSIAVPYLVTLAGYRADWADPEELQVKVHLRKAGYMRPLVFENNRISELYKLSNTDVVAAMVGMDSSVPVWRAPVLEASAYTRIMRLLATQITRSEVQAAYGYNAVSKILADTPQATTLASGNQVIDVPYGLTSRATAFEYDVNGLLIGWSLHQYGTRYTCANSTARLVEMITGLGGERLDEYYGERTLQLDLRAEYRMYQCDIVGGIPSYDWVDVTDTSAYSVNSTGLLTWLSPELNWYPMIRSNKNILAYGLSIAPQQGVLRFNLQAHEAHNGVVTNWNQKVPLGEYDIFLNGRSLIEGLDYYVDFPEVVIVNKRYLTQPATANQLITVRGSGFCKTDLTREVPGDRGFIAQKLLSTNNKFDLRDDKVLRITVDGALYARDELLFAENNSGVTVPDALNGAPYQVRDIVVPLRGSLTDNTYTLRALSKAIDIQVADYLTLKVPEAELVGNNVIAQKFELYSPFCCAIITDLAAGNLVDARINGTYNDNVAMEICAAYTTLLPFDPCLEPHTPDARYVEIHPHNLNTTITLTVAQYKLVRAAVRLFLNNKVELSHFLQTA